MATRRTGIQAIRVNQANRERRDYNETQEGRRERVERHEETTVNTWWLLTDISWAEGLTETPLLEQK